MKKLKPKKTITLLGSTGSVGVNALLVAKAHPDQFEVKGLAAGSNTDLLVQQIKEFSPKNIYIDNDAKALEISRQFGKRLKIFTKVDGLKNFSKNTGSDILVAATTGTTSLESVLDALKSGKKVALANKEILVMAGELVMRELKKNPKAKLLPVDSEHSAIFQCLEGQDRNSVERLILTSSGGPLREVELKKFATVTKEFVINHPRWKMGKKISVDSATLMNKGLEVIEAGWLFDLPIEKIDVLIHPEAVIHSMVEFIDGSTLAQAGVTDMRLPIQYALSYPSRLKEPSLRLDWSKIKSLNFSLPDHKKFPCLGIAYEAARQKGSVPCVLTAADEVAVNAYLDDKIDFLKIPTVIEKVLKVHRVVESPNFSQIQKIHSWALEETKRLCQTL